MWIQIIGPSGSGKTFIADHLQKGGYELIDHDKTVDHSDSFLFELSKSQSRLKDQIVASDQMYRRDVVTFRSFWDSHEVFINVAQELQEITSYERQIFQMIYDPLIDTRFLISPNAVVYMKMPTMSAYNRMLLRNVDVNQDRYNLQVKFYEDYVAKIAAPLIEIDGSMQPEQITKQLEFDLSSIKATYGGGTIWKKDYFRGIERD